MHYALPLRRTGSHSPAFALKPNRGFQWRRIKPQFLILLIFGVLAMLYHFSGGSSQQPVRTRIGLSAAGGSPSADVVLVTTFDEEKDASIMNLVKKNRENYAKRHGYATFFPSAHNYSIHNGPLSWAKVPAMRHAMTLFPQATYLFYLEPHSLIMNTGLSVTKHIMDKTRLEKLMITNVPIVPPDSVIKTFSGLSGDRIEFVLTQDKEGLSEKSFIMRSGEWAKYMLDAWFDPLYRTYNFQKAERHALEHIIQWHGTMLAKLALVPQNIMNSYHDSLAKSASSIYKQGDFIISFGECDKPEQKCEENMKRYANHLSLS